MPDINDLPKYSPWPSRLLGLRPVRQVNRTPEEVTREFESEKWGSLQQKVRDFESEVDLSKVEEWQYSSNRDILGWAEGEWQVTSAAAFRIRYFNWVIHQLNRWIGGVAVAELGAGYGSVILNLAKSGVFGTARLYSAEYTQSGMELIRLLAEREGISIITGSCDFASPWVLDLDIPPGTLIYTSYAAHYIPEIDSRFVQTLSHLDPSIVVHLEPLYEHCFDVDLLSLMRRRYLEVNDYNRNLLTLLRECERRGEIEIVLERPPSFGSNPLLAASVVAWRPC